MRALLLVLLIVAAVWLLLLGVLLVAGRGSAARELVRLIPNVGALIRGLARDRRVPRGTKLLMLVAVVWIVSPIDPVPEFIPVVGAIDDLIIAALALRRVVRVAGREVLADHWRGDPAALEAVLRLLRV